VLFTLKHPTNSDTHSTSPPQTNRRPTIFTHLFSDINHTSHTLRFGCHSDLPPLRSLKRGPKRAVNSGSRVNRFRQHRSKDFRREVRGGRRIRFKGNANRLKICF
jgi:hypothetical protein